MAQCCGTNIKHCSEIARKNHMAALLIAQAKDATRKTAFAARKAAFDAPDRPSLVARATSHTIEALAQFQGAVLAGYMPMRTELDPLLAMAAHRGKVAVPVIIAAATPLKFREWTPDALLVDGAFGAKIPAEGAWLVPRVVLVPLLAFDARGYRMGYGGGFYDRTLEMLRAAGPVLALGFGFAAQEIETVPTEPTDQPLDGMITEAGLRWFR
jgi:5-formyltetrahydrofolate cyclo-ligase